MNKKTPQPPPFVQFLHSHLAVPITISHEAPDIISDGDDSSSTLLKLSGTKTVSFDA
jgi:hypothetical protein